MKIMEFGLKWVHMARYELILRLDGALWLTIISKPLLTPQKAMKGSKNPEESKMSNLIFHQVNFVAGCRPAVRPSAVRPSAVRPSVRPPSLGRRVDFLEAGKSRIVEPGNPEFWDLEIQKCGVQQIKKSQNSNPFCPKCRQGLD